VRFLGEAYSSLGHRRVLRPGDGSAIRMKVIDSIHEDGAKLVELTSTAALALRARQPGLRLVPLVYYRLARAGRMTVASRPKSSSRRTRSRLAIQVVSARDGSPVSRATVVAFTDFGEGIGDEGRTNAKGVVALDVGRAQRLERLYVYPERSFWGALRRNVRVAPQRRVEVAPLDFAAADCLAHHYGHAPARVGRGVRIGVVDTGSGPHPDLQIEGGANTVVGEREQDFGDNGDGHGTHVAGIIGARGAPPNGRPGVAPGVTLRSYRVFGHHSESASNYSIAKAIDRAVADDCDIVNLSLGGEDPDEATRAAVADARARGVLVIAAAGNEDRSPVGYPAAFAAVLAVSAAGRKGTFPKGSTETGDVARPYGTDRDDFLAAFSNVGPEIDLTGPGVGVVSTVPGGYAVMSGTSMACPAITGFAARLLASHNAVMSMPRDQARSDAMARLVLGAAHPLGFGQKYEGHGLPR